MCHVRYIPLTSSSTALRRMQHTVFSGILAGPCCHAGRTGPRGKAEPLPCAGLLAPPQGFSGSMGLIAGIALKKVGMFLAVVVGVAFAALQVTG